MYFECFTSLCCILGLMEMSVKLKDNILAKTACLGITEIVIL